MLFKGESFNQALNAQVQIFKYYDVKYFISFPRTNKKVLVYLENRCSFIII